jgi:hypothetical protein
MPLNSFFECLKVAPPTAPMIRIFNDGDYVPYKILQGKVVLCVVRRAFMPGCTKRHLPDYANNLNKLDAKIVFVIVTDPSILHEWNLLYGHLDIDAVADPLTVFISAILFSLRYFFCFTAEFSTPIPKSDFSIQ